MLIGFLTIFRFREKNTWLHFNLVCDLLWNRCTAKWNCSVHNKILWHSTFTQPISGTVERHKIESKPCLVVYLSRIKVNRKNIVGGGRGRGSESKGWRGKIGNQSTVLSSIVAVSFFSDLSCITDKIVDAPHLELYLKSTSGRRDGFGFNLLFRLEMNISCRECGQDNISKLSSRYITSWSSPRWNIAVGV